MYDYDENLFIYLLLLFFLMGELVRKFRVVGLAHLRRWAILPDRLIFLGLRGASQETVFPYSSSFALSEI